MLFAASALTRSHVGLALPFAALAGGALGFISPRLLFPAVSLFLFFLSFFSPVSSVKLSTLLSVMPS